MLKKTSKTKVYYALIGLERRFIHCLSSEASALAANISEFASEIKDFSIGVTCDVILNYSSEVNHTKRRSGARLGSKKAATFNMMCSQFM